MKANSEIAKDQMEKSGIDYMVIFIIFLYWLAVILQTMEIL